MSFSFGILTFPDVQQLDLTGPYEVFASANGTKVHLIWKDCKPIRASTGLLLTPTTNFTDCPPLDVICIPGGSGINALLRDEAVLSFIRERAPVARFVTSVCTGALVLGAAGVLKGKKATTHWNAIDFLSRFGATPTDERVVQDGNVITAGGVTSGIDFGLSVISALLGQTEAEIVQLSLEYAPEPPTFSGTPQAASANVLEMTRRRLAGMRSEREQIINKII